MSARYLYRLHVEYPDIDPMQGPDTDAAREWMRWRDDCPWSWPSARVYMSQSAANKRADLLRRYGCTVTVERSLPVVWAVTS